MERKNILIIGAALCILAVVCIILVFSSVPSLTVGTSVYEDGVLKTPVYYDGEPRDVWFQYNIYMQDSLLSSTPVCESESVLGTLTKGGFDTELKIDLGPGEYKVFIYVLERDAGTRRITGFIQNIIIT
ncbi:MAG TPA: hypothetical protein VJ857_03680 [Methanocorpusculum sp.]|nr:hypothetical protein [Methanocorpusculum sp.]HJJ50782.1 hypothetical protein [Methanocorpusculum sp.]HKL97750.1 hypothetical protein [Methanocorpusculum sp.]